MKNLKEKLKESKVTVVVVAVVSVIIVAYWFINRGEDLLLSVGTSSTGGSQVVGSELIVELERLKKLSQVNLNFLNDPTFRSLEDTKVRVTPLPIGRTNPFLAP